MAAAAGTATLVAGGAVGPSSAAHGRAGWGAASVVASTVGSAGSEHARTSVTGATGSLTILKVVDQCEGDYCLSPSEPDAPRFTPGTFSFEVLQVDVPPGAEPGTATLSATPTRFGQAVEAVVDSASSTLDLDALPVDQPDSRFRIRELLPSPTDAGRWKANELTCNAGLASPDPGDATVGIVTVGADEPNVTCTFVNEFVPYPTIVVRASVSGPEQSRLRPAVITTRCSDGTTDSLTVRLDTTEVVGSPRTLASPITGPNRVTCTVTVTDPGAPRTTGAGGDSYPDPGTVASICRELVGLPNSCMGKDQRSMRVTIAGGERADVAWRLRYGSVTQAPAGDAGSSDTGTGGAVAAEDQLAGSGPAGALTTTGFGLLALLIGVGLSAAARAVPTSD